MSCIEEGSERYLLYFIIQRGNCFSTIKPVCISLPVKNSSASNGEGHHDNQVGEEGKGAEYKVGPLPESSLDHLKEKSSKLVKTIMNLGFINMDNDIYKVLTFFTN